MKENIVIYYSNKGNNKYIANKIAADLDCDIEKLVPKIKSHFFVLFGLTKKIKKVNADINNYKRIILVGPIWMGKFISPLKAFVNTYMSSINKLVFVCCCASSSAAKYQKYGHGIVFNEVKEILGDKCIKCVAFPVGLVLSREEQKDSKIMMATRLNNENFNGAILDKYNALLKSLKG